MATSSGDYFGTAQSWRREEDHLLPSLGQHLKRVEADACCRCLNLELELPLTGLENLEEMVGLPDFSGPFCEEDYLGNQQSRYQEHFASQIVLRRLCVSFHNTLQNGELSSFTYTAVVHLDASRLLRSTYAFLTLPCLSFCSFPGFGFATSAWPFPGRILQAGQGPSHGTPGMT